MKSQRETKLLREIEALKATSSSQQALLAAIPDIVMEVDVDRVYTWANQAGYEFFGRDVIGKQASHYFEGEQDTYERVQPLFEGDENVIYLESWQRRKDGQRRLLAWWCRVIKDVQEKVVGAISTGRDITERKMAEQNLRESEARFRSLLESAPVAVVIADKDGQINIINSKTEQIFGYSRDELVGQSIGLLMPERYRQGHSKHISKYFSEPNTRMMGNDLEISGLCKDGSEIPLEVGLSIVQSEEGILGMSFISDISERKRAENELIESERRYRALFENMTAGFVLFEAVQDDKGVPVDLVIIAANKGFGITTGLKIQEVTGKRLTQVLPGIENDAADWIGMYGKVALTGEPRQFEQGSELLGYFYSIIAYQAGPKQCAVSFIDITERKRVEAALQERDERVTALFESSPDLVALTDIKGTFLDINRVAPGYKKEQVLGTNVTDYLTPQQKKEFKAAVRKAIRTGKPQSYEPVIITPEGAETYWHNRVSPLKTRGNDTQLVINFTDVTQKVQVQEEIEHLARFPLENPNPVMRVTNDGQLIYANPPSRCLQELWGCEIGDALPDDWKLLISESVAGGPRQVKDIQCAGQAFSIMVAPVHGTKYVNLYASDVTKRRHAEGELMRSNVELEQFAYVASHDLQEPLRAVAGMVQLLQQRYQGKLDERADEYIHLTVEAATRMQKLIDDLLAYSRVNRQGSQFEQTDMNKVLKTALANLAVAIREGEAVVTHDPLPTLVVDSTQLAHVFQNLISNGIKFRGDRPPEVHIGALELDDAWRFEVRDNGIGIEPQYYERIFLIFQRLHGRSDYPGTGIGLSLCQKIVGNHGGRIWVESEAGQGSRFYFTIPHRR